MNPEDEEDWLRVLSMLIMQSPGNSEEELFFYNWYLDIRKN